MGLMFWRKTRNNGDNDSSVAVTESTPLPASFFDDDDAGPPTFRLDPSRDLPPMRGQGKFKIYTIPGIGTGAAYADGEAFGTAFTLTDMFRADQPSGWITGLVLMDLDDEGIQVDVPLFSSPLAGTTDNNAFAPTDDELLTVVDTLSISTFYNWNANQMGRCGNLPVHIVTTGPHLYTQCVIRGAANIAAGAIPRLRISWVPD